MLLKTKQKIIYALLSVFMLALLLFTLNASNRLTQAKAEAPIITEVIGIPDDAEKLEADFDIATMTGTQGQFKRYLYFQFSLIKLKTNADSCYSHIDISSSGTGTIYGDQCSAETDKTTVTLEPGKFYCVDCTSFMHCTGCSGYIVGVEGTMYVSDTAPKEATITEVIGIPDDAERVVADFDTDGTSTNLKNYIYFKNDGTLKELSDLSTGDVHFKVDTDGTVWTSSLPYTPPESETTLCNIVLLKKLTVDNKYYAVNVSKFVNCSNCHGIITFAVGEFYVSDTAPENIQGMLNDKPVLTTIEKKPSNATLVVQSDVVDGHIISEKLTGRYIYFKYDGTEKKILESSGVGIIIGNGGLVVNNINKIFSFDIKIDQYYCLDLNYLKTEEHDYYLSVYNLVGEFYTSEEPAEFKVIITFDMNGHGTQYSPVTVESGEKIPEESYLRSNIPESDDGYWFTGWYDENDKVFDFNTLITKNTVLHAVWIERPFTASYVSELPANARKVKVGDVITNQKIYLVATDGNPTDICFNSEYTKIVGHAQNVRLHSFFTDHYTDLICWSFPCFRNEQCSLGLFNDYGFGCFENDSVKKIVEVQYNNYYLGEITKITDEKKLNLYVLETEYIDENKPQKVTPNTDNVVKGLKIAIGTVTVFSVVVVVFRFIKIKRKK